MFSYSLKLDTEITLELLRLFDPKEQKFTVATTPNEWQRIEGLPLTFRRCKPDFNYCEYLPNKRGVEPYKEVFAKLNYLVKPGQRICYDATFRMSLDFYIDSNINDERLYSHVYYRCNNLIVKEVKNILDPNYGDDSDLTVYLGLEDGESLEDHVRMYEITYNHTILRDGESEQKRPEMDFYYVDMNGSFMSWELDGSPNR